MASTLALVACLAGAAGALQPALRPVRPAVRVSASPRMDMSEAAAKERVQEMVEGSKVFLFMKGSKLFPQCGFSNTAVQILNTCGVEYQTFDVLSDNAIREGVKK
jgi:monothiol glutaredoxin